MSDAAVLSMLDHLAPVTLDELDAIAALQTRVDRKYVLGPSSVESLLGCLDRNVRVLDIDGRRRLGYESVYFDTPDLISYHLAARRRRSRFKVRTRTYLDTDRCTFEVKLRSSLGETVKHRIDHEIAQRGQLTGAADQFLGGFAALDPLRESLRPTLVTRYQRTTLLWNGCRTTLDIGVTCGVEGDRHRSATATFGEQVIVETKCPGAAGQVDRILWSMGVRPVAVSKYATGLAALRPELPHNRWHRTLARHVAVER